MKGVGDGCLHLILSGGFVNTQTAQRHLRVIVQGNCWNCFTHKILKRKQYIIEM